MDDNKRRLKKVREALTPLDVVVKIDAVGRAVAYANLPVRVTVVDETGMAEFPAQTATLDKLTPDLLTSIAHRVAPFAHLTAEQRSQIKAKVAARLDLDCRESAGFRRGVLDAYVEKMTVPEQLEVLDDNLLVDPITEELGFNPFGTE